MDELNVEIKEETIDLEELVLRSEQNDIDSNTEKNERNTKSVGRTSTHSPWHEATFTLEVAPQILQYGRIYETIPLIK